MAVKSILHKKKELVRKTDKAINNMQAIINESRRVSHVAQYSRKALLNIEAEFESQTKLTKTDIAFLFFATALQCVRQYLLTDFKPRVDDQTAAKDVRDYKKNRVIRSTRWYNPTLAEIQGNPVPFDAIFGGRDLKLGLSGFNHRQLTLGHDPILGWIFGTANIATSTVTTWDIKRNFPPLASYHVKTRPNKIGRQLDKISNKAKTYLVFDNTKSKMFDQGIDGKALVFHSLVKEAIHLQSDIKSHKSLPIPIINSISPQLSNELASYGIDTGSLLNISKQAVYATLINTLIGMIHGLAFNKRKDKSLSVYSVRTHKIITYSNLIASVSNILYVTISSLLGNELAINKIDIGGFLVTLHRLITDELYINEIKEEFILNNFNTLIRG